MSIIDSLEQKLSDEEKIREYFTHRKEAVASITALSEEERRYGEICFDMDVQETTEFGTDVLKAAEEVRNRYTTNPPTLDDIKAKDNPEIQAHYAAMGTDIMPNASGRAEEINSMLPATASPETRTELGSLMTIGQTLLQSANPTEKGLGTMMTIYAKREAKGEKRRAKEAQEKAQENEETQNYRWWASKKMYAGLAAVALFGLTVIGGTEKKLQGDIMASNTLQEMNIEDVKRKVNEVESNIGTRVSQAETNIATGVSSKVEEKVRPLYTAQEETKAKVSEYQQQQQTYQKQQQRTTEELKQKLEGIAKQLQERMESTRDATAYMTDTLREHRETHRPITPEQKKALQTALSESSPNIPYLRQHMGDMDGTQKKKAQRLIRNYERAQRILKSYGIK